MDLGVSDLERPSTDNVKHGQLVYVDRSDYEGVGVMGEVLYVAFAVVLLTVWWVIGGEDED